MAHKRPRGYGYVHVKQTQRKRPGRHSKKVNKKTTAEKISKYQAETTSAPTKTKTSDKKAPSALKVEKKEVKKK